MKEKEKEIHVGEERPTESDRKRNRKKRGIEKETKH